MTRHPADLSISEAGEAIRKGDLSAQTLTEAHLARIGNRDQLIGAFVHVAEEAAIAAARGADAALARGDDLGPLHGIPFAIKDIFDVAGWPVRWGSKLYTDRVASVTAPAVQAMLDAGAVPLGLVATYELATVGPDQHGLYPQPRNPWNPAHITGGSSSGSAAAVAAGMVRIALGSDTGGSVRSPSAYCGVVGLKPTYGAVPVKGVMPLAPSMDHVGPVARTVPEARIVMEVLAGRTLSCPPGIAGMRVAYGRDWCHDRAAHADLAPLMDNAASVLSLCGARVALCRLPSYADIEITAAHIIHSEQYATFGDAVRQTQSVGRMAAQSILQGATVSKSRLLTARKTAAGFGAAIDAVLMDHDVLILPTTMAPAPPFTDFAESRPVWTAMRTIPFNVTGHPALMVPMGFADGLPLGLQIVGRHGDEARVLAVGAAFESATDHGALSPNLP